MNIASRWQPAVIAAIAVIGLSGCTVGNSAQSPQSHFAFPNSNVIPIGESQGSHSKLCGLLIFNFGSPSGADQDIATKEALEKAKGDILINVRTDSNTFFFPGLFTVCTTSVQGTAAKMEIGRQQLGPMSSGTPASGGFVPSTPAPSSTFVPATPTATFVPSTPPVSPPPTPMSGCTSDADCKAGRVCRSGACTSPQ